MTYPPSDPPGNNLSTLIVIAKAPVPGRVKTRLTPPFTPDQAAELARAALQDTLEAVLRTEAATRLLVLDGDPDPAWLPPGFTVIPQVEGTLDHRLVAAFEEAANLSAAPALLVGMDTPQITPRILAEAIPTDREDATIGPADDGGFWSLAFREPRRQDFAKLIGNVPMSHPQTGRIQLQRLTEASLRTRTLQELCDIDTADDATRVAAEAPQTRFARHHRTLTTKPRTTKPQTTNPQPTRPWTTSDPYARAITTPGTPLVLRTESGRDLVLDAGRFTAPPDTVDLAVLDRCQGPTLDLGCGPGRLVAELAKRGIPALGVDVAPTAVLLGRAAGAAVLRRSIFDRLPGTGRWPHALLMDGNIGIGGDPGALLERMRALLLPVRGELVVETELEDVHETHQVRFADPATSPSQGQGPRFAWARIGTEALVEIARPLGYSTRDAWTAGGRRFVALVPAN